MGPCDLALERDQVPGHEIFSIIKPRYQLIAFGDVIRQVMDLNQRDLMPWTEGTGCPAPGCPLVRRNAAEQVCADAARAHDQPVVAKQESIA